MRRIRIIVLFFCFIININATINNSFDVSKNYVPNYYRGISDNHYFIDDAPFEYSNETLKRNTSFINSGFINTSEYNISLLENATFLNDGLNTWAIDGRSIPNSTTTSNATKVTLFARSSSKVSGKGTISNPWYFEIEYYNLTFDSNGGNIPTSTEWIGAGGTVRKELSYGSNYGTLPEPTKNGYTFLGWYTSLEGGSKVSSEYKIDRDITLYANYLQRFTLTLNSNGGSIPSTTGWSGSGSSVQKTLDTGSSYGTLPEPTKSGFKFDGWYTSLDGGNKVTNETNIDNDTTLYAHYTSDSKFSFTYTGSFKCNNETTLRNTSCDISVDNWYVKFLSKGTITITSIASDIDIFIVGGGGNGGTGCGDTDRIWGGGYCTGGKGGSGGAVNTQPGITVSTTTYDITVGSAGNSSSAFGYSASGAGRGNGGSSGTMNTWASGKNAGNGGDGVYAFNDSTLGGPYAAGGGGGGCGAAYWGVGGGNPGNGGSGSGGAGYAYGGCNSGSSASSNTGAGGGGGGGWQYYGSDGCCGGGAGGSGIVIIRNKR